MKCKELAAIAVVDLRSEEQKDHSNGPDPVYLARTGFCCWMDFNAGEFAASPKEPRQPCTRT